MRRAILGNKGVPRCDVSTLRRRCCPSLGGKRCVSNGAQGYQSFGSFHSDDVEVLIRESEDEYITPEVPFDTFRVFEWATSSAKELDFGENARSEFFIDSSWTFLNHGAFGGSLREITRYGDEWRRFCETQPLRFYDRVLLPHLVHSHRALGKFINCEPVDVVLVPNATTALNAVMRSLVQGSDDNILMLDVGYGAIKKVCETVCRGLGATADVVPISESLLSAAVDDGEPSSVDDILVGAVESSLQGNTTYKVVVLDHTTSNTGLNLPVEKIARVCKEYGCIVVVDGAHGLLARDLDMRAMAQCGVDFYAGNCHKWLASNKGLGFMWTNAKDAVKPVVISHGYDDGYLSSFMWDGCRDYSAALTLPYLLQFWDSVGQARVREYQKKILVGALRGLSDIWHDGDASQSFVVPSGSHLERFHSPLGLVRLPSRLQDPAGSADSATSKAIQDRLHHDHKIEVPVKNINGQLFCRLSAHIYNTPSEYEKLGHVLLAQE